MNRFLFWLLNCPARENLNCAIKRYGRINYVLRSDGIIGKRVDTYTRPFFSLRYPLRTYNHHHTVTRRQKSVSNALVIAFVKYIKGLRVSIGVCSLTPHQINNDINIVSSLRLLAGIIFIWLGRTPREAQFLSPLMCLQSDCRSYF